MEKICIKTHIPPKLRIAAAMGRVMPSDAVSRVKPVISMSTDGIPKLRAGMIFPSTAFNAEKNTTVDETEIIAFAVELTLSSMRPVDKGLRVGSDFFILSR